MDTCEQPTEAGPRFLALRVCRQHAGTGKKTDCAPQAPSHARTPTTRMSSYKRVSWGSSGLETGSGKTLPCGPCSLSRGTPENKPRLQRRPQPRAPRRTADGSVLGGQRGGGGVVGASAGYEGVASQQEKRKEETQEGQGNTQRREPRGGKPGPRVTRPGGGRAGARGKVQQRPRSQNLPPPPPGRAGRPLPSVPARGSR